MTLTSRVSLDEYDMSEYRLDTDGEFSVSAFMIETSGTNGNTSNESLGVSAGKMQTFRLSHRAVNILSVTADNERISPQNFALMEDTRLLRVAAAGGKSLKVSYNWQSEPVKIYQVTASYTD